MNNRFDSTAELQQLKRLGTWGSTTATSFFEEFRKFALKGSVVDLAVGVIIGAAFAKIVDSLVKNIIMPAVSLLMPTENSYTTWKVAIGAKEIPYGLFLGDVVNFVIVALALFLFAVKFLGWMARRRSVEAAAIAVAAPTKEEQLLAEIRDLLAAKAGGRS